MNLKNVELAHRFEELYLVEFKGDTMDARDFYKLSDLKAKVFMKQLIDYFADKCQSEFRTKDGNIYKFSREKLQ